MHLNSYSRAAGTVQVKVRWRLTGLVSWSSNKNIKTNLHNHRVGSIAYRVGGDDREFYRNADNFIQIFQVIFLFV